MGSVCTGRPAAAAVAYSAATFERLCVVGSVRTGRPAAVAVVCFVAKPCVGTVGRRVFQTTFLLGSVPVARAWLHRTPVARQDRQAFEAQFKKKLLQECRESARVSSFCFGFLIAAACFFNATVQQQKQHAFLLSSSGL